MTPYLRIVRFTFLRYLAYPIEIVAGILKQGIAILLLFLFWWAVTRSGTTLNTHQILAYVLISGAVGNAGSDVRFTFSKFLQKTIKYGELNTFLVRPVNVLGYLFASNLGSDGLDWLISLSSLAAGLLLQTPPSLAAILLFLPLFVCSFLLGFSLNVLIGCISFYTPEATGIRHTLMHVIRFVCGSLIPLSFFPIFWRGIAMATPFPSLVFAPAGVLTGLLSLSDGLHSLVVGIVWSCILVPLTLFVWKQSLKHYDAVGI